MTCEKFAECGFFKTYGRQMEGDTYRMLIDSYCCGSLMDRCHRKTYELTHGTAAPDNLSPSGYCLKRLK